MLKAKDGLACNIVIFDTIWNGNRLVREQSNSTSYFLAPITFAVQYNVVFGFVGYSFQAIVRCPCSKTSGVLCFSDKWVVVYYTNSYISVYKLRLTMSWTYKAIWFDVGSFCILLFLTFCYGFSLICSFMETYYPYFLVFGLPRIISGRPLHL